MCSILYDKLDELFSKTGQDLFLESLQKQASFLLSPNIFQYLKAEVVYQKKVRN